MGSPTGGTRNAREESSIALERDFQKGPPWAVDLQAQDRASDPGEVERRLSLLLHVRVQELWQETNGRLSDSCLRAEGTHSYLRMRSLGRLQRRRRSAEPWQNYQSSIPEGGQTPANEGLGQFVRVHQRMEEHQDEGAWKNYAWTVKSDPSA